jgi:hypothetical protein
MAERRGPRGIVPGNNRDYPDSLALFGHLVSIPALPHELQQGAPRCREKMARDLMYGPGIAACPHCGAGYDEPMPENHG